MNEKLIISNDIDDDVKLLFELIGEAPRNIFVVCCGDGRESIPLAKAGHKVTGMDIDKNALANIPAKTESPMNFDYLLNNVLTAEWGGDYDTIVLTNNTLMNLEQRDDDKASQQLVIKKAAEALKPGGHFYLVYDYYPEPEKIFVFECKRQKGRYGGIDENGVNSQLYNYGGLYNPVTRIAMWNGHWEDIMPSGEKLIFPEYGYKHICSREDVHGWLKNAGFAIEEEYSNYNKKPFNENELHSVECSDDIIWAKKI